MSTDIACTRFHAHAWKKDLCVNCLKNKGLHGNSPTAAKRPSKPGGKPSLAGRTDVIRNGRDRAENGTESTNRPSIAAKPRLKQQASDGAENESSVIVENPDGSITFNTGVLNMADERQPSLTSGNTDSRRRSGGRSGRSSRRPMSPPPQAPGQPPPPPLQAPSQPPPPPPQAPGQPPQAPGQPPPPPPEHSAINGVTDLESVEEIMRQATTAVDQKQRQEKHYYHKYDVSGSLGRSGTSQTANFKPPKNVLIEKFKLTHDTMPPFAASYEVDEVTSQPIAMPYTIVDVSTRPPADTAPPRLPSTPAPERENGGGGSSTTSSRGTCSSSSSSSLHHEDVCSPSSGRRNSPARSLSGSPSPGIRHRAMREVREVSPLTEDDPPKMPKLLYGDTDKQFRSPTPPRKVPILIQNTVKASHTYEPMENDGLEDWDNGNQPQGAANKTRSPNDGSANANEEFGFMRQSSTRSSGMKSAAFEAKLAVLSGLNLGGSKQTAPVTDTDTDSAPPSVDTTSYVPQTVELPLQTPPGKRKQKNGSNGTQKNKEPTDAKVDKNKKGRGFFRRFFRSREPDEAEDTAVEAAVPEFVPPPQLEETEVHVNSGKEVDRKPAVGLGDIREALARRKLSIDTESANSSDGPCADSPCRKPSVDRSVEQTKVKTNNKTEDDKQDGKYKAMPVSLKTELLQKGIQSLKQSPKPTRKVIAPVTGHVIAEGSPLRKPHKAKKPTVAPPTPPPGAPVSPPVAPVSVSAPLPATPPPPPPPAAAAGPLSPSLPPGPPPPPPTATTSPLPATRRPPKPTKKVSLKNVEPSSEDASPTHTTEHAKKKLSVIIVDSMFAEPDPMQHSYHGDTSSSGGSGDGQTGRVLHVDTSGLPDTPHSPLSGELSPMSDTSGDSEGRTGRPRSRADRNSKMCRSMMGAPPPPPDGGKRKSQLGSTPTSPNPGSLPSSPTHSMDISSPMSTGSASQTLPRQAYRREHSAGFQDESSRYRKKQQTDSVAKHARNKTVSEGVKIDLDDITLGDRTVSDEQTLGELGDYRSSKFINRALPAPPTQAQQTPRGRGRGHSRDSSEHDVDNLYELVPSERGPNSDRGTYEDIDDEDIEADDLFSEIAIDIKAKLNGKSLSEEICQLLPPVQGSSLPPSPAPDPPGGGGGGAMLPRSGSSDYLEPITHTELDLLKEVEEEVAEREATSVSSTCTDKASVSKRGRPKPSRRKRRDNGFPCLSEPYVIMYANTDVLLDRTRPALSIPEALAKIAMQNVETLQHVTDAAIAKYMSATCQWLDDVHWRDYSLRESNPCLTQGYTCFYRTRTAKVQPYDGYIMISARSLPKDMCNCHHIHLLHPALMFSDRISAEYFAEPPEGTDVDHYQFYGMVQTNIAVVAYDSIQSLQSYLKELDREFNSSQEQHDRDICYLLAQVFSGVLHSQDQDPACTVCTLHPRDLLVVTSGGRDEKYVVVNNVCQAPVVVGEGVETLCHDLINLIFYLLNLQRPGDFEMGQCHTRVPGRSTYCKGLQIVVKVLGTTSFECLITAWNMLQFMLWGPDKATLKSMTLSEQRDHCFSMWLEVARSSAVNKVAMEGKDVDLRTASMFRYLYSTTGSVLLETTQLLSS